MRIKNYTLISVIVIVVIFLHACDTFDPVTEIEKSPYVLNGFFNGDSAIILNLTEYLPFRDSLDPLELRYPVKDANISLFNELSFAGNFSYILDESESTKNIDHYKLENPSIKEGQKYSVEVILPDQIRLRATDILPYKVPIISVDTTTEIDVNNPIIKLRCRIRFHDPGGQKNYYSISAIEGNYDEGNESGELYAKDFKSDDPLIEGRIESGIWNYCYFSDQLIDNQDAMVTCEFKSYLSYREINYLEIQLNSISENYYLYSRSVEEYFKSLENFYAEPVQIFSNIEGGYGIFAGFSRSSYRIYIPGKTK